MFGCLSSLSNEISLQNKQQINVPKSIEYSIKWMKFTESFEPVSLAQWHFDWFPWAQQFYWSEHVFLCKSYSPTFCGFSWQFLWSPFAQPNGMNYKSKLNQSPFALHFRVFNRFPLVTPFKKASQRNLGFVSSPYSWVSIARHTHSNSLSSALTLLSRLLSKRAIVN